MAVLQHIGLRWYEYNVTCYERMPISGLNVWMLWLKVLGLQLDERECGRK